MIPAITHSSSTETPPAFRGGARRSRSWIFVLVTTVAAIVAAAVYTGIRSVHYEATANVLVAPLAGEDPNFQGIPMIRESSDGSRPVQTAAGLLSGPSIARLAASRLGQGWTQAKVESAMQVDPRGASNIVAITAEAESASEAARVANLYVAAALELRQRALKPGLRREIQVVSGQPGSSERIKRLRAAEENGDPTLSISAQARPPTSASSPSTKLVLLIAMIVGLLVGIAGVMVFNVSRATAVDSPSD